MTCRGFREVQNAYLDGELDAALTAEVHAHLLQCPECQQQVAVVRACGDVIRVDRRAPRLSGNFTDRLMASLPARYAGHSAGERRRLMIRRFMQLGVAPAAAAALALAAIGGWRSHHTPAAPTITPAVAGVSARITDAMPEVDHVVSTVDSSLQQFQQMPGQLRALCEGALQSGAGSAAHQPGSSFVEQLLHPLYELLDPPVLRTPSEDDVERF